MSSRADNIKVSFLDEHLENVHFEHSALRRKLQSKVEALTIMSRELDVCRAERDQFKLMAEQIQCRFTTLKKNSYQEHRSNYEGLLDYNRDSETGFKLLNDLREQNKMLMIEVESLKQRLSDTTGDIKLLRKVSTHKLKEDSKNASNGSLSSQEREAMIRQIEDLNNKVKQLKYDLRAVLDEKEEIVNERDAFKCKVHRLNHELGVLLKSNKIHLQVLDIDALIMENKYLSDRLSQAEAEKELANQAITKYKCMLETKRKKGAIKLGSNSTDMVMSHKQVKQLLEYGSMSEMPITAATVADLKALCLGLLEAVNDKGLALSHQRKTNRILAVRIAELEHRLENIGGENGAMTVFPSQILLQDYQPSKVDEEVDSIECESTKNSIIDTEHINDSGDAKEHNHINAKQDQLRSPNQMGADDQKNCYTLSKSIDKNHGVYSCKNGFTDFKFVQKNNYHKFDVVENEITTSKDFVDENSTLEKLPPALEALVQKALEDIKSEKPEEIN